MAQGQRDAIEALYLEDRKFPPPEELKRNAWITQSSVYEEAERDWQGYWAKQAAGLLDWYEQWHTICEWELPFAKWFLGGKLNVSVNCLDRHVAAGLGNRVAYHWEGEPGDTRTITYADLLADVERFANVLKRLGVGRGDRVAIYMPMIPELPVAMLALRPDRRGALGGLRRLLLRRPTRSHRRRQGQGTGHCRRWLSQGQAQPAQAGGRRGPGGHSLHHCGGGSAQGRRRGLDVRRARLLVARGYG